MFQSLKIYKGEDIAVEEFLEKLSDFGYSRAEQCSEMGDFSRRGEVIDVFPLNFEDPIRIQLEGQKIEKIKNYDLATGKALIEHGACVILPIAGLRPRKIRGVLDKFGEDIPIDNFIDIEPGDLVVHVDYGVGRYLGIEHLKVEKKFADHIVIEYSGKDKLYVPMEKMHLVQKYIGFEGRPPKIYKLGTKSWQNVKVQAKKGITNMALDLLNLQAARSALKGFSFSPDTDWQAQLEKEFPYKETPDQAKSSIEVKKNMESPIPMDRLICGDVGYGKTEVALRASFKAVMDNKQVAILVPTTILAEQHYKTFKDRLKNFPVNVQMLSRFRTDREQKQIIDCLINGGVDIIIGTHRLLSGDISFKDLGLVIIDEEQRFGVKDKEKLKKMRLLVDVLTMTATPIPRTLYMSLMGIKDMSVINTAPMDRLPIQTHTMEFDEEVIKEAIQKELKRKGQVFFIHNRVESIIPIAKKIASMVPEAKLGIGHGQMSAKQLEEVMLGFIDKKIDVLVSTAIVESGIDIPNANTIIIDNADQFGLAELYQLRGRVGRFNVKAYAYFLVKKGMPLTKESEKRLQALERFTELGAGFKIAMEDLKIRGAGNLLGMQQHGYVNAVGFDLYCRLLRDVSEELKKKKGIGLSRQL